MQWTSERSQKTTSSWCLIAASLLLCWAPALHAQSSITPSGGARGAGMGAVGVVFQDAQSILANQAGMAFLEAPSVTVFGEQRFLLADLRNIGAGFALPAGDFGAFGLSLQYFGTTEYNEQRAGLAYARRLFAGTSIGLQFNAFSSRIPDYGNTLRINAEIGLQTQLMPKLLLGFHLANPLRTPTRGGDRMPAILRAGLGYQTSDKVLMTLELEKDMDFPLRAKTGIEYRPAEAVSLRAGATTQPATATLGLGFRLPAGLAFDFAGGYHQFLGFTPTFGLTYTRPARS